MMQQSLIAYTASTKDSNRVHAVRIPVSTLQPCIREFLTERGDRDLMKLIDSLVKNVTNLTDYNA